MTVELTKIETGMTGGPEAIQANFDALNGALPTSTGWKNATLQNGATPYDSTHTLRYCVNAGWVEVTGPINIPKTNGVTFAQIDSSLAPATTITIECSISGTNGTRRVSLSPNGSMSAAGMTGVDGPDSMKQTNIHLVYRPANS